MNSSLKAIFVTATLIAGGAAHADDVWRTVGDWDILYNERTEACLARIVRSDGAGFMVGYSGPAADDHYFAIIEPTGGSGLTITGASFGQISFENGTVVTIPLTSIGASSGTATYTGVFRGANRETVNQVMGLFARLNDINLARLDNDEQVQAEHGRFSLAGSARALRSIPDCLQANR